MPRQLFSARELSQMVNAGAQLIDVLEPEEFEHSHLPGAINIPLKELGEETVARLDRMKPVIVYCNDFG
jgi:rhodanese-related sulfurtransferase